jgi:hypothetical protein
MWGLRSNSLFEPAIDMPGASEHTLSAKSVDSCLFGILEKPYFKRISGPSFL